MGLTLVCQQVKSQFSIELVDSSQGQTSFRGLSVVTDKVVWVSGSKGTVGLSKDGGKSWKWMQIPGFEKSDFRDIEAFDKNTAIIMASGTPAVILKTVDGGDSWKVVFRDNRPEMFLDAMDFWDKKRGMLVGDPINGRFVLLETTNGGDSWRMLDSTLCPKAHDSEAVFAASGTSLDCYGRNKIAFVSGGSQCRLFEYESRDKKFSVWDLPMVSGTSSKGAFAMAYGQKRQIVVVGGDYLSDTANQGNVFVYDLAGRYRVQFGRSLSGYKSGVAFLQTYNGNWGYFFVATGTSGTDFCALGCCSIQSCYLCNEISDVSFNVVRKAKKGKAVFLAGSKGRIAKLNY